MRGRAVRLLQRRLAALKYYPGRVDGRFGSDTLEAVWAFQDTQGLLTPTGDFTTLSFMPGRVTVPLGEMYNPVFFIGTTFAIHGDTHVPRRPASHGCVRIPTHIAAFFHTLVPTPGTPVYIRG